MGQGSASGPRGTFDGVDRYQARRANVNREGDMTGLRSSGRRCEVLIWCGVGLAVGGLATGLGTARASGAPLRQLAPLTAPPSDGG